MTEIALTEITVQVERWHQPVLDLKKKRLTTEYEDKLCTPAPPVIKGMSSMEGKYPSA